MKITLSWHGLFMPSRALWVDNTSIKTSILDDAAGALRLSVLPTGITPDAVLDKGVAFRSRTGSDSKWYFHPEYTTDTATCRLNIETGELIEIEWSFLSELRWAVAAQEMARVIAARIRRVSPRKLRKLAAMYPVR